MAIFMHEWIIHNDHRCCFKRYLDLDEHFYAKLSWFSYSEHLKDDVSVFLKFGTREVAVDRVGNTRGPLQGQIIQIHPQYIKFIWNSAHRGVYKRSVR